MTIITDTDGFWVRWQSEFITGTSAAEDVPAVSAVVLQKQSQNEHSCLKTASGRKKSGLGNSARVHGVSPLPTKPSPPSYSSSCAGPSTGRDPSAATRGPGAALARPGSGPARNRSRSGRRPGRGGVGRLRRDRLRWPARPGSPRLPASLAVPHRGPGTEQRLLSREGSLNTATAALHREHRGQYYFFGW